MTRKNQGARLKQVCLSQSGSKSRGCYTLDEPLRVRIWHRRIHGKDESVATDYAIRAVWTNCLFGDCDGAMHSSLPWWAVKKFEVKE